MDYTVIEYAELSVAPFLVETVTDWNMFFVALGVGILATIATIVAVWYTNKKTRELYEETRAEERKQNAMVIIKPMVKVSSFHVMIDNLIRNDIWDRVLLLSGKDGFTFFDERESARYRWDKILSLKNEVYFKDIKSLWIKTNSTLTDDSGEETPYSADNYVELLRSREEIVFRLYSSEQKAKQESYMEKRKRIVLEFDIEINYLTLAGQQVKYEYKAKIIDIPMTAEIKDEKTGEKEKKEYYSFITEMLKDGYIIKDKPDMPENQKASAFRNLQDDAQLVGDRVAYRNEMSGREQGRGMMAEVFPAAINQMAGIFGGGKDETQDNLHAPETVNVELEDSDEQTQENC